MRVETGGLRVVAAEAVDTPEHQRETDDRQMGQSAPDESGVLASGATTPGAYIRAHRLRRGVSLDQLAAMTKIPRTQLELLEDDQLDALPGMVFAKGFLRCCARSLELDPDTVHDTIGTLLKYQDDIERIRGDEARRLLAEVNAEVAAANA